MMYEKKLKSVHLMLLGLFLIALNWPNSCSANEMSIPTNVDPGLINKNFRIQSEMRLIPKEAEEIDTSNLTKTEDSAVYSNKKFKLNSITYSGSTVFDIEKLNKLSAKLIGSDISLNDLNNIADTITDMYKKQGYLTSKAIIPPQVIKDGNVKIQIIEGSIGKIKIDGGKWVNASYIQNTFLTQNNIEENKLFNVNSLSQSMAEVNTPKYLKGTVTLGKGKEVGQTDIILDLKDRFPLSVGVGWDNTGRELVGIQRAGLFTSIDNVTGKGDRIWVNNSFASRTYGLDTGYSMPIGKKGDKLIFGYSYSDTNLGGEYSPYNIKGKANNFTTSYVHPLIKRRDLEINSRVAFDMMHAKTTMLDTQTLNNYELRILRAGISGNKFDEQGRWLGDVMVSAGLPFLGATQSDNSGEPDAKFVKFNTYLTRVQRLPKECIGIARFNTQIATGTLFPAEQMQLGGAYTVRGYNEGSMLGDVGYVLSFEVRTPIPFLPETVKANLWNDKKINIKLRDSVKFAVFYDQGWTRLVNQGIEPNGNNFFNAVGAGLRVSLGHNTTANFDLGVPIGPPKYDGQAPVRFHFSISTNLL